MPIYHTNDTYLPYTVTADDANQYTVVVADGATVGLVGHSRRWYAQRVLRGRTGGTDLPVVRLDSAGQLLEGASPASSTTPVGVVFHGSAPGRPVDGPATRELLAGPAQEALNGLAEPVPLENLGRHPRYVLPNRSSAMLDLLFAEAQELRGTGGELLGRARYVVLWWNREGGASDLVLCGANEEHLGGAFAAHGLRSLEALMERVPSSSPRSMVTAAPPPAPSGVKRPEDYQYPYLWNLNPNMSAYAPDELVTLTFTITNVSDWPTALNYVPPRVTISSVQEGRDVAVLRHGVGHRTLEPGETATFTLMWDQTHFEGGRASAGRYIARIQLADLAVNWLLDSGPQADLILGELPEQMR